MAKVTYEDMFALLDEICVGAGDKTRTMEQVSNPVVKSLIAQEYAMASSRGILNLC